MLKKGKSFKYKLAPWVFLLPALISFTLFKYYPIVMGMLVSFYNLDIVNPPGKFVGLDNYIRAFKDPNLYNAVKNNLEFAFVILILNFWCPIALAILVNEVRKGRTFFRTMYFIPAIAPGIAVNVLWKYIWQPDYGFANYILSLFNLPPQLWLNDVRQVKWCMQFPGLIVAGGMNFIVYLAALQEVPEEHYEAALIDGAGFIDRIRYITIPQIIPIVKIMLILTLIEVFNMVDAPLVMTGGGPAGSTETLVLYAFKVATRDLDYSYGLALSTIAFAVVFVITAFQMKLSRSND